ncbi:flagellar assembly peptidoglycan hydrolase FlgJ [Noviherbaspirillum pedocola]|uniref:Peptidoglycan hydrolase FlgJ n=1 Tax=Noviherbaspirillum pedocola TaxID=2801341 RepID=A0A934SX87_9BURK|nr:flagellar assembly peptidoglycan hydrolase FlgJ [Noviherbaspirillum pedocola]MBK4737030.1 flagellar assembly peptidoglycan hydrolase FlgJ [Noviherbaspirillum pedocola]
MNIDPTRISAGSTDTADLSALRRSAQQNSPEALKTAAHQFEALFMNMVLKSMRDATPQDSPFDSQQSRMYTSMLDQKISDKFAGNGLGLADALMRQLANNAGMSPDAVKAGGAANAAGNAADAATSSATTGLSDTPPPGKTASGNASAALPPNSVKPYPPRPAHVAQFQDKLMSHAEEASRSTGIPAKFMLGQAALETGWGKREIRNPDGSSSHNLFGIKAGPGWKGKTVQVATTEYVHGVPQKRMESFRAYDSYADSFRDYASTLKNNPRYQNVIAAGGDATGFAQGLQRAGYATDPQYAAKLSRIIKGSLSA